MNILTKIKRWFGDIVYRIKLERAYRKKLKEIKKKDPYIYKQETMNIIIGMAGAGTRFKEEGYTAVSYTHLRAHETN